MKNKIAAIILIVISLALITTGIIVHYKYHRDKQEEVEQIPSGVDFDENVEDWRTKASIETMQIISEIYPEDYEFTFSVNNKFNITLEQLQNTSNKDFNIYSKYGVKCDMSKSEFIVEQDYDTKEEIRTLNLDCQPISEVRTNSPKTKTY